VATGSEVSLARDVATQLEAKGVGADVISMPSMSRFLAQDADYIADILPKGVHTVSIEAGVTLGWQAITGLSGQNFGIDSFGASAPADALYDYFGLTVEKIVPQILTGLGL